MSVWKRSATVLLVMAAMVGCASPPSAHWAEAAPPETSSLQWGQCPDPAPTAPNTTFTCATLKVPQDWSVPDGKTLELALLRARRDAQQDQVGSLLVNPGGPGGSGVEYVPYFAKSAPVELLRRFDVIGFDPRGVGRSTPVECVSDADTDIVASADPDPRERAQFDAVVAEARRVGETCLAKYGQDLRLYSTRQTAHDMEAIRVALGEEKLTYLGYSYGTLLGAVYAHQYPKTLRAAVLDGAVDPTQKPVSAAESQARGFERAFDNFAAWCARPGASCPIGPDARQSVATLVAKETQPRAAVNGRYVTPGWTLLAIVASLYQKESWPILARALGELRDGKAELLFRVADSYYDRDTRGHYSNLVDANLAISCADSADWPDVEEIRQLQNQWRVTYPLFGAATATGLLGCAVWPGERDPYQAGPAVGSPPLLVIGTRGDPATPYEQTATLATLLGTGMVVTSEGEGHTAYPDSRCVAGVVNRYLIDRVPPTAGTVCPAE